MIGTEALTERVAALRCGLDAAAWDDAESAKTCKRLVAAGPRKEMVTANGKVESFDFLPFDLAQAHDLYNALLGSIAGIIKDKRLIVVPSGPLISLPFNLLVTEPPEMAVPKILVQYRNVAWLGARTAITVLPSVASHKALRQFAKASRASKPYLGIGNPLLDGAQDDPVWGADNKTNAVLARTKRCSQMSTVQLVAPARGPRPVRSFGSIFRGTQVDIEQIRYQAPLPETADELCEVARRLGVPDSEILLGANATEARLKQFSEQGRLADYVVLHFATHGALSGEIKGSAEPGPILTPPPKGTTDLNTLERDDGFLTASEITNLKLDAEWVILSACNTAGAQGKSAEALSGLARAFFYAGARALLVSHWEVGSDAAVKLTTRAFSELKAHPEIGRAEAMRVSMRELIQKGNLVEAHPSQWASFVVVGEGGALQRVQPTAIGFEPPMAPPRQILAQPAAVPPTKAVSERPATIMHGFVAALSSHRTREDALKAIADLQQMYSHVLAGKATDVKEVDLGIRGVWYRAVVGPPASRDVAAGVCSQLKTAGYSACWVATD